jgi:hypothetical protein
MKYSAELSKIVEELPARVSNFKSKLYGLEDSLNESCEPFETEIEKLKTEIVAVQGKHQSEVKKLETEILNDDIVKKAYVSSDILNGYGRARKAAKNFAIGDIGYVSLVCGIFYIMKDIMGDFAGKAFGFLGLAQLGMSVPAAYYYLKSRRIKYNSLPLLEPEDFTKENREWLDEQLKGIPPRPSSALEISTDFSKGTSKNQNAQVKSSPKDLSCD